MAHLRLIALTRLLAAQKSCDYGARSRTVAALWAGNSEPAPDYLPASGAAATIALHRPDAPGLAFIHAKHGPKAIVGLTLNTNDAD